MWMRGRDELEAQEHATLAPYAVYSDASRGRRVTEPEDSYRTAFQRDRDRIIHSSAYRRLGNKTQVFVTTEGEYYRTRLTHTEEVTQIALTVARSLGLNLELTEAICRVHDLGHPPFGHAGEAALSVLLADEGGFEHNAHTLRLVDLLEREYPDFPGLNLTWEVREGIARHGHQRLPGQDGEFTTFSQPSLEAQVVDVADSIAYGCHDLDDGLTAGLLSWEGFETRQPDWWQQVQPAVAERARALPPDLARRLLKRHLINLFVSDLIQETSLALAEIQPPDVAAIRTYSAPLVRLSPAVTRLRQALHDDLTQHLYRHFQVETMWVKAQRLVEDLFHALDEAPRQLPETVTARIGVEGSRHRMICDYIAGMTDRKAVQEHHRLYRFDLNVLP
jgi:dGTPase